MTVWSGYASQWDWALKIFFESDLIKHITYKEDKNFHWYAISDKGISAVVSERQLKEATKSSVKAIKIATYSLWITISSLVISVIFNITQIFIQTCFK